MSLFVTTIASCVVKPCMQNACAQWFISAVKYILCFLYFRDFRKDCAFNSDSLFPVPVVDAGLLWVGWNGLPPTLDTLYLWCSYRLHPMQWWQSPFSFHLGCGYRLGKKSPGMQVETAATMQKSVLTKRYLRSFEQYCQIATTITALILHMLKCNVRFINPW